MSFLEKTENTENTPSKWRSLAQSAVCGGCMGGVIGVIAKRPVIASGVVSAVNACAMPIFQMLIDHYAKKYQWKPVNVAIITAMTTGAYGATFIAASVALGVISGPLPIVLIGFSFGTSALMPLFELSPFKELFSPILKRPLVGKSAYNALSMGIIAAWNKRPVVTATVMGAINTYVMSTVTNSIDNCAKQGQWNPSSAVLTNFIATIVFGSLSVATSVALGVFSDRDDIIGGGITFYLAVMLPVYANYKEQLVKESIDILLGTAKQELAQSAQSS